jgi:adenine-specific DNA-methyltransferase
MSRRYEGQVELTWTNKHRRLVVLDEPLDGLLYRWVEPSDYRSAEVRLLREVAQVGDPDAGNYLIHGDALHALTALASRSAGIENLVGKVRLAYLDPPFNTGKTFEAYEDNLEVSIYLTMMRDLLSQIHPLMSPDGSIWVHCDDSMQGYLRLLMDEVFLSKNFVATLVWQKRTTRENRKAIGSGHDYILVYAMRGPQGWRDVRNKMTKDGSTARNPDNDPRGPWRSIPFSAQGSRPNQMYPITTPTGVVHLPPKGRCWANIEPRYLELLEAGMVYFPKNGNGRPRIKQHGEIEGLVPSTWWPASEVGDNDEAKKEILALFENIVAFDTPKPERLMRRIIEIATNEGDVVLDPFAGSASTAAVAHKLGRRWITSEILRDNIDRYALPRLSKVVSGDDLGGISEAVEWEGGGGFTVYDVAPSMFDEVDGAVLLADWAVGGDLGAVVAAQLGFTPDLVGPFCGRKGRTRLAVIDGLVNRGVADLLLDQLEESESLLVCGTGLDPEVSPYLAERRPGAVARLVPAAILSGYGRPRRWTPVGPAEVIR